MLTEIINILRSPARLYYCLHDWVVTCKVILCNKLGIHVIGRTHSQAVVQLLAVPQLQERIKPLMERELHSDMLRTAHAQLSRPGTWISGQTLDLLLTIFETAYPEANAHHYSKLTGDNSEQCSSIQEIAERILQQGGEGLFFIPFVDPHYHHVTMIIVDVAKRSFRYYDSKDSRDPTAVQVGVNETCLSVKAFCQGLHQQCGWSDQSLNLDLNTRVRDQEDAHNCGIHVALKALRSMRGETSDKSPHQTVEADRVAFAQLCQTLLAICPPADISALDFDMLDAD